MKNVSLTDDDLKRIRLIVSEEVRAAIGLNLARNVSALSSGDLEEFGLVTFQMAPFEMAGGIVADRALGPDELSKMLGYSRATLKQMRTNKSKLIEGLPMFKLCNCEATRRPPHRTPTHITRGSPMWWSFSRSGRVGMRAPLEEGNDCRSC